MHSCESVKTSPVACTRQTRICTAVVESRLRQAGCFMKPVQGLNAGLGQLHKTEMPTEGLEQVGKNCWRD